MQKNNSILFDLDFMFDEDERNFKQQVCDYLQTINIEIEAETSKSTEPDLREIYRLMGAKGYLAPSWPVEYGGLGKSMVAMGIVSEEMAHHQITDTLQVVSVLFAGQLILKMGSAAQRQKYLRSLAQGKIFMSILYSEENSGSDLASLTMRADPVGNGYYELTGTKIYSLKSMQADYALCAARTSQSTSKYEGISLFIVPLQTSEVEINAVPSLMNESFCEVKFNKLNIHESEIIGQVNDGWSMLNKALNLERTGLDLLAKSIRWLSLLRSFIQLGYCTQEDKALELYSRFKFKLSNAKYYVYRILRSLDDMDIIPESDAATAKYYMGELSVEIVNETAKIVNWTDLSTCAEAETLRKTLELALLEIPGLTLSAGTSEIMLESIARAELYLNELEQP